MAGGVFGSLIKSTIKSTAKDLAKDMVRDAEEAAVVGINSAASSLAEKSKSTVQEPSSWFDFNALTKQAEEKQRKKQQAQRPQRPQQAQKSESATHTGCTCSCPVQNGGGQALMSLTLSELKQMARELNIPGRSKMNKSQLAEALARYM